MRTVFCIGGPCAGDRRTAPDEGDRFEVDVVEAPLACRPSQNRRIRRHVYAIRQLRWDGRMLWIAFPDDKDLTWAMAELLEGYREGRSW